MVVRPTMGPLCRKVAAVCELPWLLAACRTGAYAECVVRMPAGHRLKA